VRQTANRLDTCLVIIHMLPTNNSLNKSRHTIRTHATDQCSIDQFLEREKRTAENDRWNKLNKSIKLAKILNFAHEFATIHNLSNELSEQLTYLLTSCIEHKKMQRARDVCYDKTDGVITSIPGLVYCDELSKYTYQPLGQVRSSTLKNLTPKHYQGRN
jgi:hypothetical protein